MDIKEHYLYMYSQEFWYSLPDYTGIAHSGVDLYEIAADSEWPIIWHLAHIVHKEEVHVGHFVERPKRELLHPELNSILMDGSCLKELSCLIPSIEFVEEWHAKVREATISFISGLSEKKFYSSPEGSPMGHSVAKWLSITLIHTGVHLGRIDCIVKRKDSCYQGV